MTWGSGRQSPDTALMRFASHRFPSPATFLDIGSGEGANARELRERFHYVWAIDKDPGAEDADEYVDVCAFDIEMKFDCIYDVNTLCHIEDPPFEKIKGWLKPEGIFFSICPTYLAPAYVAYGKDFTRTVSEQELREMLEPFFDEIRIYFREEPDFKGNQLESWIVEARP